MKKKLLALGLVLALGSLVGCGSSDSSKKVEEKKPEVVKEAAKEVKKEVPANPTPGGVLTISMPSSPKNLDPIRYTGTYESQIIDNVCNTLVDYSHDLSKIVPSLATSWTVSEDGKTYTFKLREDVFFHKGKFQDGRKLTAEDIKYSLERSAKKSAMNRLGMVESCDVISEFEVAVNLKDASSVFLTALTDAGNVIVPREEVEGWGDDFGSHLVGTGPFVLEKFELDQQTELKRNENYWVKKPYLDGVVFRVVSDGNQAANALRTGEINVATSLTGEAVKVVREDKEVELLEMPGLHVAYVYLNQVNGPTKDIKVREAIIKAVDREALTLGVYQYQEAVPASLMLPPGSWGYDEALVEKVPSYDPEGAKKLLTEAGYPDGFEMDIYISNTAARVRMATLIQAYLLQNLNVKININTSEWGTFSEMASSGKADIYGMSWTWYPDPFFFLNKLFHSSEIGALGNGQGYNNPEVDRLLDEALVATEQNERAALYKKALAQVVEDKVGIFYANENVNWGVTSEVQGLVQRPDGKVKLCTPEVNVWMVQ